MKKRKLVVSSRTLFVDPKNSLLANHLTKYLKKEDQEENFLNYLMLFQ